MSPYHKEHTTLEIARITPEQLSLLQEISRTTFDETFGSQNEPSDMETYLDRSFSKEQLSQELNHPGTFFYCAKWKGEWVGYLKINTDQAQTEPEGPDSLEIERIYVKGIFQGKGLGKQLFDFAMNQAQAFSKKKVWLGVWEHNLKAINFYTKNGFVVFGSHDFQLGNDLQTDLLMHRTLD